MIVSRTIAAPRSKVFDAFMTTEALLAWLPPKGMHGEIERFEARTGGGYRMTLRYDQATGRGKTTSDSDTVDVRFVELVPGERIVQAIDFVSPDAAFAGTMTMTWSFADAGTGTEVTVRIDNAPPGIRDEDHEAGIASSLDQLTGFVTAR